MNLNITRISKSKSCAFKKILDDRFLHNNAFFIDDDGDLCVTIGYLGGNFGVSVYCFRYGTIYEPDENMEITPVAVDINYYEKDYSSAGN